ncbi:MAG TPA: HAD family hydrolase [Saprospiraceae bacterium]|nr:HAD family hydrolase [Saprospiraceae bacterium]
MSTDPPMASALFLDRDGVLNVRPPMDYVKTAAELVPAPGVGEAVAMLSGMFDRIVVVTNQAGIGKGLMSEEDLAAVHQVLLDHIEAAGGRIDAVYYCPHRKETGCECRKPATGMARQANIQFPEIDFSHSWMVGDSASDMVFGQVLGMRTVLIEGKFEEAEILAEMTIDYRFESLLDFARFLRGC